MTIQRLSIVFAALGLGLTGLSAQPTPQPGVQPPVTVVRALTFGLNGSPIVVAYGRATAQIAANASVATYIVGAADGSFEVSANVNVTTSTTYTFTAQVTYTDEGNTARTVSLPMTLLTGGVSISVANGDGAGPRMGIVHHIRAKAGTTITILTQAAGTYTTVTYNVEGVIKQIA